MINIILPNFYYFFTVNEILIRMYEQHPEYFYSDKICFSAQEGNFPYMYWSSSFVNQGTILYPGLNNYLERNRIISFIFDCANPLLQMKDLNDTANNTYLKLGENGSNKILISSYSILKELQKKYPQYKFIGSEYYIATDPDLEGLSDLDRIKVFYKNSDLLQKIPINKTEIVLNDPCENCTFKTNCLLEYWTNNYTYSKNNHLTKCNYVQSHLLNWNTIETFNKKGYQYFSFNLNHIDMQNLNQVKEYYINLFIKEEHRPLADIFFKEIM